MLSPEDLDLLDRFDSRRYVALTEAEAAELGSGCHAEWSLASPHGVHLNAHDYVELLNDGEKWHRLCDAVRSIAWGALVIGGSLAFIFLLGFIADVTR